jgi:hypothetical protein
MNYVGSRFEGLPLGQGLPPTQMQDRSNTSLDGWATDVADVVAHLTSAIATIAGHVAKPSDKVVDLMSSSWMRPVIAWRSPSSPSMHSVTSLDFVRAAHSHRMLLKMNRSSAAPSTSAFPNCLALSIIRNLTGPKEER